MHILLVEDDENLIRTLKFQLEKEGFTTDICRDGEEALFSIEETIYDLILLDRMLPGLDGLCVLKKIRKNHVMTPVILLTALGSLSDKVTGLDCGADDYLVKPFAFEELCARIRSISRRPAQMTKADVLCFSDLTYFPDTACLKGPDGDCHLSRREGSLLEVFLRNASTPLSRSALLLRVWGPDSDVEEGNLDNYIYFLRRRIKAVGSRAVLQTVRMKGYCLKSDALSE